MQLCVACSSTLDSNSRTPTHYDSEKPSLPQSFPCGHILCADCTRTRPSLAKACILCQTADDLLRPSTSTSKSSQPASSNPPVYSQATLDRIEDDFVLGNVSDDEEYDLNLPNRRISPPSSSTIEKDGLPFDDPPAYRDRDRDEDEGKASLKGDEKDSRERDQCNLHYLQPKETMAGLALKYGVEGSLLCRMNRLPISTLSTTPHLLHTLPFLLLPPHSKPSTSTTPILEPEEERRRLIVRRFQLQTKCPDYSVAKSYVEQVFKKRDDEMEFVRRNREARRVRRRDHEEEGDDLIGLREGGEMEEAVENYLADERWEREQKENGMKGKGTLFGSKMKSTGQVEAKAKSGWKWI